MRIDINLIPYSEGWHSWVNVETAPAWASLIVAIAAVVVAVIGNILNSRSLSASLRQEIIRTNADAIRMADDLRNRMLAARKSNEDFISREFIHHEVAETFREMLDFDDSIKKLDFINDQNLRLIEASPKASRKALEEELHKALLMRVQLSILPARFDETMAKRNLLIMRIAENPASRVDVEQSDTLKADSGAGAI